MATRDNKHKPPVHLVPARTVIDIAEVFGFGAEKYGDPYNWRRGGLHLDKDILASAERHLIALRMGEDVDPESGLHHLQHLMTNAAMALEGMRRGFIVDDRNLSFVEEEKIPDSS